MYMCVYSNMCICVYGVCVGLSACFWVLVSRKWQAWIGSMSIDFRPWETENWEDGGIVFEMVTGQINGFLRQS